MPSVAQFMDVKSYLNGGRKFLLRGNGLISGCHHQVVHGVLFSVQGSPCSDRAVGCDGEVALFVAGCDAVNDFSIFS